MDKFDELYELIKQNKPHNILFNKISNIKQDSLNKEQAIIKLEFSNKKLTKEIEEYRKEIERLKSIILVSIGHKCDKDY